MSVRTMLLKARLKEWLAFDSVVVASLLRSAIGFVGCALYRLGNRKLSFRLMAAVHRAGKPEFICRRVTAIMRDAFPANETNGQFDGYLQEFINTAAQRAPESLAQHPERMLKNMAIVVSSSLHNSSRGVIIVAYNYAFPLLAKQYDLKRIAQHYHIVLEPSWSGYCSEDILCYEFLRPHYVFVQAYEPHDAKFINNIDANFVALPLSANWWGDYRKFLPDPSLPKDLDFVMVASWADFKRHHRFFAALRNLRRRGHRLVGACVGYPAGRTLDDIKARADYYAVADQIEFHEFIPQAEVAKLMNRAKVNVVWSRKEGVNRVIIEGMFCDVPCLIPEGFNYGFQYPYINEKTGRWSNDRNLERDLLEMTKSPWPHSPAEWVQRNMTPHHATEILESQIAETCREAREAIPHDYAVKINGLHGMDYWDQDESVRFEDDYEFLRSTCKFNNHSLNESPKMKMVGS